MSLKPDKRAPARARYMQRISSYLLPRCPLPIAPARLRTGDASPLSPLASLRKNVPHLKIKINRRVVPCSSQLVLIRANSKPGKIPAIEACGRFLLRCVHPFVAADTLMIVAREQVSPGSSRKYPFL